MCRSISPDDRLSAEGCEFEFQVLGRCPVGYKGYIKEPEAIQQVRKNQPARKTSFMLQVEQIFASQGVRCVFSTAVGTALDRHHHADGIVEFYGEVFKVDATKNPLKTHGGDVDVVFGPEEVENPLRFVTQLINVFVERQQRASRVFVVSMERPLSRRVRAA